VTVQVGGFANFVGAHFWNFQVIPTSRPARSNLPILSEPSCSNSS
jgi:hypothetical protein